MAFMGDRGSKGGAMSKPYLLKPVFDKKRSKWRLNIPGKISPSGHRVRHYFKQHHEALAEANKIRQVFHDYGRSIKIPPANRLIESIECWDLLDGVAPGGSANIGSLRKIVLREVKAIKDREKSITLAALLDDYVNKLKLKQRAEHYIKQFGWLRGHMDFWLEEKVSDLTPGNIRMSLGKQPSGAFNSDLRLLRAVLTHGVKNSWLKTNPALSVDFIHRPRVEVKCLSHLIVERMFRHAQEHAKELIPPYVVGFMCGLRESEIWKIHYSDIRISDSEKHVIVPASISKVKRKRIIPLSGNAVEWMRWYIAHTRGGIVPQADERLMSRWNRHALKVSRQANYEAAAGEGMKWQQNCKRRAFASHYVAATQDLNKLALAMGHSTTELTFEHYIGAVTHEDGLAYFDIRP
jgi:site-specific recombinase XerD